MGTSPVTSRDLSSITNLRSIWERLHSTTSFSIDFEGKLSENSCTTMKSSEVSSIFDDETCVFRTTYCKLLNCSHVSCCQTINRFISKNLNTPSRTYPSFQIFPFVQNHIHFNIQILFPAKNLFETNLTAFLYPFRFQVWLSCLVAMTAISLWLIGLERQSIYKILFWQHSTVLEQGSQLRNVGARGSTLIGTWMISLFLIRQFYGSSLYSFMTTKNEPNDYPKSIYEAISRKDFDFICSRAFKTKLFYMGLKYVLTQELFNFYLNILRKSYFTIHEDDQDFETLTQQNISHGKETRVYSQIFNKTYDNSTRLFTAIARAYHHTTYISRKFKQFIYICESGCMDAAGFFGQTRLIRKLSKDRPLLTYHQFWSQQEPGFESFRFSKFLSCFVKSGLYELEINRFRKLTQVKRLKRLESSKKGGWSNVSLFSYAFLDVSAKEKAEKGNMEEPMKMMVLKGTFILMEVLVLVSVLSFLVELRIIKR
ncbi:unnamed protein product [Orchesella dallaii]|uniref:Uncharacterized protein n=1 Tax=Orchesella dallaii TaxID=48710 RepID=A0ABP1RGN9_9HEXA